MKTVSHAELWNRKPEAFARLWTKYIKPSKMVGNLYFVGNYDASTHIIDTGNGLILIDPGHLEHFFMVINNIWELGFRPTDIKYIVLSHAHADHVGATKALVNMSGAKTFLGEADLPLLRNPDFNSPMTLFDPDHLLRDGDVIRLGNTEIKCLSTPGHTDGTMSFFFNVEEGGVIYRAGMFGGAGTNTLTDDFMKEFNIPQENREKFKKSIERLRREKVDIFVGNHSYNNKTYEKIKALATSDKNPFIDPDEWEAFLDSRLARFSEITKK